MRKTAYDRRFGVEIECGLPQGSYQGRKLFPEWRVGSDGSGVEVKTPILQGARGYATLRYAMERLKENGGYVTGADGLHVHHDAPEFINNPQAVMKLVESWRNNMKMIYKMVHPRRRSTYGPAPQWHDSAWRAVVDWAEGRNSYLAVDRYDLNVAALRKHGSIEIRLHEGTLDADVAIAWVQFGQKFIAEVLKRVRPIAPTSSDTQLMARIRLSPQAQAMIEAKKRRGHIEHYA